jgi:hypothetical protein
MGWMTRAWAFLGYVFTDVGPGPAVRREPTDREKAGAVMGALSHFADIVGWNWSTLSREQQEAIYGDLHSLAREIEIRWAGEKRAKLRDWVKRMRSSGISIEDLQEALKPAPIEIVDAPRPE